MQTTVLGSLENKEVTALYSGPQGPPNLGTHT